MDYIELDAASNRGIDEARDLLERAAYKPSIGRFKVFMIDEAHQLTKDAFSALLKTLEEPPDYLKFVLATTDPEKMLPTVLSRCLQFNLRPIAPEVVLTHLQQVLRSEGVDGEPAALRLLARAARGSMRDALSLTDQAIAYGGGRLDEAAVRGMLGAVEHDHAAVLVEALARRDGPALLGRIDLLRSLGLSAGGTLDSMAALLQQMAVEQAVPGALAEDDVDAHVGRRLAGAMPADETQLLYSIVLQGRAELGLMSDEYGALTMVLLRMLAFAPGGDAAKRESAAPARRRPELVLPPSDARSDAAAPEPPPWVEAPPPEFSPSAAGGAALRAKLAPAIAVPIATPPAFSPTGLGTRWAGIVGELLGSGAINALARELALQAGLVEIDTSTQPPIWRLCVERDSLRTDALRDKLGLALAAVVGAPGQLVLEPGVPEDSPARRDALERERRQSQAEAAIRSDPLVLDLMAQFKSARIVPGSIKPV
jgi:DNA polymerase-3 subunit gamma/tau